MKPEEKILLEETAELARENNKILRSLKRGQTFSRLMRIFYWSVIIFLSIFGYYAIQPYIDQMKEAMGQISEIKNTSTDSLSGLLDVLK